MPTFQSVQVHRSLNTDAVQRELVASLRRGVVPGRMLYESPRQSARWLEVAAKWSPFARGKDYREIYQRAGAAAWNRMPDGGWSLLGVGCGDGQKETELLRTGENRLPDFLLPMDISLSLVLAAAGNWCAVAADVRCTPVLGDFALMEDGWSGELPIPHAPKLVTFFGMLPNFNPAEILPRLRSLIAPDDVLLLSANLAPGDDYARGVQAVLPQYDNAETRRWLAALFEETGAEGEGIEPTFRVTDEECGSVQLKHIEAICRPSKGMSLTVGGESVEFDGRTPLRVFTSYRYRPDNVTAVLGKHGIRVDEAFVSEDGEEGVFVCRAA